MDISAYLVPGKRAHLAGIGGVSMSPLAEVLHGMGLNVQGSDMSESPAVAHLRATGREVSKWFRYTTQSVMEELAAQTGFRFGMDAYDEQTGAAEYRFTARAQEFK